MWAPEKSHQLMKSPTHGIIWRASKWWEDDIDGCSVIFEVSFMGTNSFDIMDDGSVQNDGRHSAATGGGCAGNYED